MTPHKFCEQCGGELKTRWLPVGDVTAQVTVCFHCGRLVIEGTYFQVLGTKLHPYNPDDRQYDTPNVDT